MQRQDDIEYQQLHSNRETSAQVWRPNRPGNYGRPNRPNRPIPPYTNHWVLAAFATRLGAQVYLRQLQLAGIHGMIVNFDSRLLNRAVAVRINTRDQFLARRVLNSNLTVDFLGWFYE